MCFNRYMVECEYQKNASIYTMTLVLIDTWWNVNFIIFLVTRTANKF